MKQNEITNWFSQLQESLEPSYMAAETPWQQSGFSGPYERWIVCRRPISDCMTTDGAFLDIGCANGYLLECVLQWTAQRGIQIEPWGIDLSEKLVAMAKERLMDHVDKLLVANGLTMSPPRVFEYVRTELGYVPKEYHQSYIARLVEEFLSPGGKLLVPEYRSRKASSDGPWVNDVLGDLGFSVETCVSGFWENKELTRVAVVRKET